MGSRRHQRHRLCHPDHVRARACTALLLGLLVLTAWSCKSGSSDSIDPYEASGPREPDDDTNLLEVDTSESDGPEPVNPFPSPPKTYSITLDGAFDEWDDSEFRDFDSEKHVVEGQRFWDGEGDASLRVAARADRGYLYLAAESVDDTVVTAPGETIGDAMVVWLRSPGIASIAEMLPSASGFNLQPDVAYLIEPDGSVRPYAPTSFANQSDTSALKARTTQTDDGWQAEIAMEAGAIPQLSHLPIREVAFRVESFDGDEPKHPSYQSRLNILPAPESKPRFAVFSDFPSGGWLPYRPVLQQPPRRDTLGRWRLTQNGWTYDRFDAPPRNWTRLNNTDPVKAAVTSAEGFIGACPPSRRDVVLPAGFESSDGQHRAALVLCGRDARSGGSCPADAELRMYWTRLQRVPQANQSASPADKWELDQMATLTDEPMEQCIGSTSNPPLRRRFTLLPLDRVHEQLWALGFQAHASSGNSLKQAREVWLFRPGRSGGTTPSGDGDEGPRVAKASLDKLEAESGSRMVSNSLMYLTPIDDRDGWDLCRIETIKNQDCRSFNEQCSTRQRGQEVLVHIDMWDPETRAFTDFMMTKHRRCGPDFDFSSRKAYMLIQHQQRLSLIRSPALR